MQHVKQVSSVWKVRIYLAQNLKGSSVMTIWRACTENKNMWKHTKKMYIVYHD